VVRRASEAGCATPPVCSSGSRDTAPLLFGRAPLGAVERDVVRPELVVGLGRVPEWAGAGRRLLGVESVW
jgi:hypothetical protein